MQTNHRNTHPTVRTTSDGSQPYIGSISDG
jgi:hypothetical protein